MMPALIKGSLFSWLCKKNAPTASAVGALFCGGEKEKLSSTEGAHPPSEAFVHWEGYLAGRRSSDCLPKVCFDEVNDGLGIVQAVRMVTRH